MNSKLIGGILLVVGTTIGAGMLALPVATAEVGFWGSLVLLISCWGVMTACSFLFLEVNLWLPANSNIVSMAGATLGKGGQIIAWLFYLILLYSILSAYIGGGGNLFQYTLATQHINIPQWFASILFTALFGMVVYLGIRAVDYVNRFLMFGKLGAFILLTILILPFVTTLNLNAGHLQNIISRSSLSTTAVSFACLLIIPSLRSYFDNDVKMLRKAILIGTLIPLLCYIVWDIAIMGVIPLAGNLGLKAISQSPNSNSDLLLAINSVLNKDSINMLANFFTNICMATSFLSVSLSLSDFLADGLQVAKRGMGNALIFGLTFLPPIGIVIFYPGMFLLGIQYAGLCVFILMILLPPLMVWRGRYYQNRNQSPSLYHVPGGKFLLAAIILFASLMTGLGGYVFFSALLFVFATLSIGMFLERGLPKPVTQIE